MRKGTRIDWERDRQVRLAQEAWRNRDEVPEPQRAFQEWMRREHGRLLAEYRPEAVPSAVKRSGYRVQEAAVRVKAALARRDLEYVTRELRRMLGLFEDGKYELTGANRVLLLEAMFLSGPVAIASVGVDGGSLLRVVERVIGYLELHDVPAKEAQQNLPAARPKLRLLARFLRWLLGR